MIAVVQRVSSASVSIEGINTASIGKGLLVFLGVKMGDSPKDAEYLAAKIAQLRILADQDANMNLSVCETNGELLVISQFTLLANTSKGNRPSFMMAEKPEAAKLLYELFVELLRQKSKCTLKTGEFGADMQIALLNDGPVTIIMNSKVEA